MKLKKLLENIFSVKNEYSNNKKYKIIRICGAKIKHTICKIEPQYLPQKNYESDFVEIYQKVQQYTMLTLDAAYANYKIINYLEDNNIQGDIVECGVWRGGSCMLIALALMQRGNTSRKIYLYDTYSGMTEPTEKDDSAIDNRHASLLIKEMRENKKYKYGTSNWCEASIEDVKENLKSTGYPLENLFFVKGDVNDTLKEPIVNQLISFLRLDTDWYDSTKIELEKLYPKLVDKGVLVVDDYYRWQGSKQATKEYFKDINKSPLLIKVDSTAISIKRED